MPPAISACMTSWNYTIIVMHTWAYKKERKSTFLTAFEQREKEARSLFAAQCWYRSCLWMSLSSESSVSNIIPRYLYSSTGLTFWPPNFSNGVAVLFALLALNVIQTVLLQLKIIPCDTAYAWHTSSILCNQQLCNQCTLGQNTQISSANITWFICSARLNDGVSSHNAFAFYLD